MSNVTIPQDTLITAYCMLRKLESIAESNLQHNETMMTFELETLDPGEIASVCAVIEAKIDAIVRRERYRKRKGY